MQHIVLNSYYNLTADQLAIVCTNIKQRFRLLLSVAKHYCAYCFACCAIGPLCGLFDLAGFLNLNLWC